MPTTFATLLASIVVILVGCELFTNGVEWFGRHFKLGDGSVGSILAAVGTALPETVVPILAIAFGTTKATESIGIGAIIGSSFMLATLAMFVTGIAVAVFAHRGCRPHLVSADPDVIMRDLGFFVVAYSATVAAALFNRREVQIILALSLIVAYFVYVYRTVSQDEVSGHSLRRLHLQPGSDPPHIAAVAFQMIVALAVIVIGAKFFVTGIESTAQALAVPALVFSLLVTPFATELPEKLNSVIWIRQGKDTLALGNITGAMVFQACILPAIGILLTPWVLTTPALVSATLGIMCAAAAYAQIKFRGGLRYQHLVVLGFVYVGFAAYAIGVSVQT